MRIAAGSPGGLLEAFKPGTAPPDSYSIIGYEGGGDPRMPMGVSPEADRAVMRPSGLY
jgi:penicillin-binding protein 1A